jgi:hypothetical protein
MKLSLPLGRLSALTFAAAAIILSLSGCGAGPAPCTPGAANSGRFCYLGIDFGRVSDPVYKEGIRDGCRTGKGEFRKNYRLSGSSEAYRRGWDKGRTLCRPADWSDDPTYSYHPLPNRRNRQSRRSDENRYLSASERIRRYAAESPREPTRVFDDDYAPRPARLDETLESIGY